MIATVNSEKSEGMEKGDMFQITFGIRGFNLIHNSVYTLF